MRLTDREIADVLSERIQLATASEELTLAGIVATVEGRPVSLADLIEEAAERLRK